MAVREIAMAAAGASSGVSIVGSTSTLDSSGTTTVSCDIPTGTTNGDLMVAFICINVTSASISTPSGWTVVKFPPASGSGAYAMFYKTASSEGASVTITTGSTVAKSVFITAYRGAKWGGIAGASSVALSGAAVTAPVGYQVAGGMAVGIWHTRAVSITYTTPTGMTPLLSDTSATAPSFAAFYAQTATTGSSDAYVSDPSGTGTTAALLYFVYPSSSTIGNGAITVVSSGVYARATGTSVSVSRPTVSAGDLMVLFSIASGTSAKAWSGPTTEVWTEVIDQAAQPNIRIAWRIATTSESASPTVNCSSSGNLVLGMMVFRNAVFGSVSSIPTAASSAVSVSYSPNQNSMLGIIFAGTSFNVGAGVGFITIGSFSGEGNTTTSLDGSADGVAPSFNAEYYSPLSYAGGSVSVSADDGTNFLPGTGVVVMIAPAS